MTIENELVEPRIAVESDYEAFMTLATEYLLELRVLGSEVQLTTHTLGAWGDLFLVYARLLVCLDDASPRKLHGVVYMVGNFGFSIAGSVGAPPVDTDFGRVAVGHGTYVRPAYRKLGYATRLRDRMRAELRRLGFETIIGGVHLGNEAGARSLKGSSFTWYQVVGYERLQEDK